MRPPTDLLCLGLCLDECCGLAPLLLLRLLRLAQLLVVRYSLGQEALLLPQVLLAPDRLQSHITSEQ
jgi:hypothetical protein